MFEELDSVVLDHPIERYGLKKGDVGTVVHAYSDKEALEVEFLTAKGKTVAVLTLDYTDVRSIAKNEILHVRGYSTA